jgi:hypothetical protein
MGQTDEHALILVFGPWRPNKNLGYAFQFMGRFLKSRVVLYCY